MLAATANADITPQPGPILQGHASTNPSHTVLYPLELRAIVFCEGKRKLAIVTLDWIGTTLAITSRIRNAVAARTGIPADCVMVACSHTHCGPAVLPGLPSSPVDPAYIERVVETVAESVAQANATLRPVELGTGGGTAHFNVNRRPQAGADDMSVNDEQVADHRVRILRVDATDESTPEKPLAVLFNFSCHPTTLAGSKGFVSPDYPGLARRGIEAALGGHALFLPGCFGNVRPRVEGANASFRAGTQQDVSNFGDQLAAAVVNTAKQTSTRDFDALAAGVKQFEMAYGTPLSRDELSRRANDQSNAILRDFVAPWARRVLEMIETKRIPKTVASEMQLVRIGPLTMVTIPGEPVQEIGYAIERRLTEGKDPWKSSCEIWPLGYTNDMLGYMCTDRHHQQGGYEPTAYYLFDYPVPFTGEQQTLVETAYALFGQVGA